MHAFCSVQAPPVEKGVKKEKDPGEALKLAVLQTLDALLRLPRDRAEMAALLADAREAPPDACTQEEAPNLCEGAACRAYVKCSKARPDLKLKNCFRAYVKCSKARPDLKLKNS